MTWDDWQNDKMTRARGLAGEDYFFILLSLLQPMTVLSARILYCFLTEIDGAAKCYTNCCSMDSRLFSTKSMLLLVADGVETNERLCSKLFLSNSILAAKELFMKI